MLVLRMSLSVIVPFLVFGFRGCRRDLVDPLLSLFSSFPPANSHDQNIDKCDFLLVGFFILLSYWSLVNKQISQKLRNFLRTLIGS